MRLTGYYPGVVGKITELHAVYYHEHWGFNVSFETQVARELSEFLRDYRNGRDGFWAATEDREFVGAVAVDGSPARTEGARLRWFIVHPDYQSRSIGKKLLRTALRFCRDAGHGKVFLWTFEGLDPARRLYEREGFELAEENEVEQWGATIIEQKFELTLK